MDQKIKKEYIIIVEGSIMYKRKKKQNLKKRITLNYKGEGKT